MPWITGIVAFIVAGGYIRLWHHAGKLHEWRAHLSERGEASLSLVIVAVSLIAAITVLLVLGREVPAVFQQGLTGVLFGITGGELSLRRSEKKAGAAVHPARATTRTPSRKTPNQES